MLTILVEVLGNIVFQFLIEVVVELVGLVLPKRRRRRADASHTLALGGLAFSGIAAGAASAWLLPHEFPWHLGAPVGLSLILAPLGAGVLMHFVGAALDTGGSRHSNLATFSGGAVFAFGFAWARFFLL